MDKYIALIKIEDWKRYIIFILAQKGGFNIYLLSQMYGAKVAQQFQGRLHIDRLASYQHIKWRL